MCHISKLFTTHNQLQDPVDVVLGDGRAGASAGRKFKVVRPGSRCDGVRLITG